ncbi:hypothetical protein BJ742DRAFT_792520 [Cladochytrium replicatum]|nr:hypothetical protein BJ742DRAFT_792520 [Cladochytrium replicatum]
MANTCTMTHTGSDGSTAGSRIAQLIKFFWAGENIAAGYITIQSVVDAWNNSPVHHEILTDGRALAVGFGYAVNNNCPMYKTYWSADFGETSQPQ